MSEEARGYWDEVGDQGKARLPLNDPRATKRDYYWVWATDPGSGRLIVLGPFLSDNEAQTEGFSKLSGLSYEVTPLNTRDRHYAKDKLNYIRMERGQSMTDVMKRAKYKT